MGRIEFTPKAEEDIDRIWLHIAEDNLNAANRFVGDLYDKLQLLADNPLSAVARPELGRLIRSRPFQSYMIFYEPLPDGILLLNVLWGGVDIEAYYADQ